MQSHNCREENSRALGVALEEETPAMVHDVVRRLPVGAELTEQGGVHFRVWAPKRERVDVVLGSAGDGPAHALEPEGDGYFSGHVAEASAGTRYRYRLDGGAAFPDPASRFQPLGPLGPSRVVDPGAFAWTDGDWRGARLQGQVLYELHVGTFTPQGTFAATAEKLPALVELGVTCVEIMPVAEFAGRFGWGYDGVDLYAPYHVYGDPDDLRRLVDSAHRLGLAVILDVVYNHLGPVGAYHRQFSDDYYHRRRDKTDWGDALNFDGQHSAPVREFFIANAGYWVDEFHCDGLRLDATHAIADDSDDHILAALTRHARQKAGARSILIIAEDEAQDSIKVRPVAQGGYGLDAQWNDDFHHSALVALTGRAEAYYSDFRGTPQELVSALRWGFLFQGQHARWQKKARGAPSLDVPGPAFVTFLENHDQVANSARGERLRLRTSPGEYRALATAWLLAPGTPLFFQGQEFGASTPFLFFADHGGELAALVRQGRARFLRLFPSIASPDLYEQLPDPGAFETFAASKLDWSERARLGAILALHRDLLALRRDDPVFRAQRSDRLHGALVGAQAFVLRYLGPNDDDRLLLVNLGRDLRLNPASEPLMAPPRGRSWMVLWYSEHPRYGGCGAPPLDAGGAWHVPGRAAVVLQPAPETVEPE